MKKLSLVIIALLLINQLAFSETISVVGEIFQTLDSHSALASVEGGNIVYIQTTIYSETILYDGKKLNFKGQVLGTYQYESKDKRIRTVPVVQIE